MRRILFVSGFHPATRARDLAYEFERYGPLVRCDVPAPRNPNAVSNPYAFVEFRSQRDAEDAYHDMHGRNFEGTRLSIQWAKNPPSSVWRMGDRRSPPPPPPRRERSRSPPRRRAIDPRDVRDPSLTAAPAASAGSGRDYRDVRLERRRSRSPIPIRERRRSRSPDRGYPPPRRSMSPPPRRDSRDDRDRGRDYRDVRDSRDMRLRTPPPHPADMPRDVRNSHREARGRTPPYEN